MHENEFVFEIPYGTRDLLPREAQEKRRVEAALSELFCRWGYDEIVTPAIEYLDTLTIGNGRCLEPHMFKLFDKDNRTLALRHEMTTPIARLVTSRMREEPLPLKLAYISNVFRWEQAQAGRQCEFNQAGVELIGTNDVAADAEVIALAIEGMKAAGLQDFQVCLGQVDFISGMMRQLHLTEVQQERVTQALERHDLVALAAIADETELPRAAKESMKKVPTLHGKEEALQEAYSLALNEQGRRALDNLSEIYRLLQEYGVAEDVYFDLGVIRNLNYYTGMVFEAYAPGMGYPICGGGRYDELLAGFGNACPATGFALGIERLLLAKERQSEQQRALQKDCYIAYAHGKLAEALQAAKKLRAEGKVCETAFQAQPEHKADAYRLSKGYEELIYIS